jgi:hypothetical protein
MCIAFAKVCPISASIWDSILGGAASSLNMARISLRIFEGMTTESYLKMLAQPKSKRPRKVPGQSQGRAVPRASLA